jgi:hypothetical protein
MDNINFQGLDSVLYGEKKFGIWGTLGSGAGCDVHFVQMVLSSNDLDNIKLISDIPESKRWSIKDLFQRNINQSRVDNQLMNYLNDPDRIKFFNPITLILLPHNSKDEIIKDIPYLNNNGDVVDSGISFVEREYKDFYKLGFSQSLQLGKFEWNKDNCFVVAIDGQHRLSALKKLKQSGSSTFKDWKIPAVLLCIHKESNAKVKVGLLEAVRKVFIDINNKAERITEARKILLNDSLVLDVVSQEIIEFAHSSADTRRLPLVFFNWRGDQDKIKKTSIASFVSVEEINRQLNSYFKLPGENDKNAELPNWLKNASIPDGELSYNAASNVRSFVNREFVPGFHVYINSILPFKKYIIDLKDVFATPNGKYCYEKDAYDTVDNFESDKELFYYDGFQQQILKLKANIPSVLNMDIGFRAIMYVYSQKSLFEKIYLLKDPTKTDVTWEEHATFISVVINKLIQHGWFQYDNKFKIQYKFLTGLIFSASGPIVNYRLDEVPNAYGALLMRLSINLLGVKVDDVTFSKRIESITDDLKSSYLKDIKKTKRSELAPTWTKTNKELAKEVQKLSILETEKIMNEFETFISNYKDFSKKYDV